MSVRDMGPIIDLSQELADSIDITIRRSLEAGLEDLYAVHGAANAYERIYKRLAEPFRQWLAEHPGESIADPEKGYVAYLKPRRGADTFDVASMPDDLVLRLARANALNVDRDVIKSLQGKALVSVEVMAFVIAGGESHSFHVERDPK